MRLLTRLQPAAVAFSLAAWFLYQTWPGLLAYFQNDDVMNLYWAWELPWWKILGTLLVPFTPEYRPTGAFFYRAMHALFGLDPLPFRIACYALMLGNMALAYRFAKLLLGSSEAAVLAAFLAGYHRRFIDLYHNGGTIYDLLCYTFLYWALCEYIAARQQGRFLQGWPLIRFATASILALNAKEMALVIPVALFAYELIYDPPRKLGWLWTGKRLLWILTFVTVLAAIVKTGPSSKFSGVAPYKVTLSVRQYFLNTRDWLDAMLLQPPEWLNTTKATLLMLAPLLTGLAARRRAWIYLGLLILILPLPVDFLPHRGFFVWYIPLTAWAGFAGSLIVSGRNWLWRVVWHRPPLPEGTWEPERIATFLLLAWGVAHFSSAHPFGSLEEVTPQQPAIRSYQAAVRQCPARPGPILVQDDPFDLDTWTPTFVARLERSSPGLDVYRSRRLDVFAPPPGTQYSCVLTYRNGAFERE